ncbi:hypothetical protein [Kitasatospora sp. NPDC051705]
MRQATENSGPLDPDDGQPGLAEDAAHTVTLLTTALDQQEPAT